MRSARAGAFVFACLASFACTAERERTATSASAIIGGRPSGDDENAAVRLELKDGDQLRYCSAYLVAPRLVMTARHCLMKLDENGPNSLGCTPDGADTFDPGQDLSVRDAADFHVEVGASTASFKRFAVNQIFVAQEISVCRGDIGFLSLHEDALDTHTPFKRTPVRINDVIRVSGWGYPSDDDSNAEQLPQTRLTRDEITVTELGPGGIPAGTFAVGGKSLCFGDSGAIALHNNAIVGVFSRLDYPLQCDYEFTRGILTGTAAQTQLITRAFDAIGEKPRYDDDPTDAGIGAAVTPLADAGTSTADPTPLPAATPADDSCAMGRSPARGSAPCLLSALSLLWLARRGRRAPDGRGPRRQ